MGIGKGGGGSSSPSPDPQIGQAALENAQLGKDWLSFAKEQYAVANDRQVATDALSEKVINSALTAQEQSTAQAGEQWKLYKDTYLPAEKRVVDEAMNYDSADRQAAVAGETRADVLRASDQQRQASQRQAAAMGINPASGRFAGISKAGELDTALAAAGAENNAREQVRQMGTMLRKDVAATGRGVPGTAAQSYSVGTSSGGAAMGANLGANNSFVATTGIIGQGYQGAMSGNNSAASILNTQYQNQLNTWSANQQAQAEGMSGLMRGISTLGAAAIMASSKEVKEAKRPVKGALAALDGIPVEAWRYKRGVADEGDHIGPYAEDFQAQTGLGDGKTINLLDAVGVTMAAVKELSSKVDKIATGRRLRPAEEGIAAPVFEAKAQNRRPELSGIAT